MIAKRLARLMRRFMDPFNYATYSKHDSTKKVYRARRKEQVVEWSSKGKAGLSPKISQYQRHLTSDDFRLGFSNYHSKGQMLVMIDFDSDKTSPTRHKDLKAAIQAVRSVIGPNIYVENSTFSDDKHGYIIVQYDHRKYHTLKVRRIILDAIKVLDSKVNLKKIEVMGTSPYYLWASHPRMRKKDGTPMPVITRVKLSGTVAKVPRPQTDKDMTKLERLRATGIEVLEEIASKVGEIQGKEQANKPEEREEKKESVITCNKSQDNNQDDLLNATSVTNDNAFKFLAIWSQATSDDKVPIMEWEQKVGAKSYNKVLHCSRDQFVGYATAWMLSITTYDAFIPERHDKHYGTVNYKEVNKKYQKLTNQKPNDRVRAWVMQQLAAWGIIIIRQADWYDGISRKFAFRWSKLKELSQGSSKVEFVPYNSNLGRYMGEAHNVEADAVQ